MVHLALPIKSAHNTSLLINLFADFPHGVFRLTLELTRREVLKEAVNLENEIQADSAPVE